MYVCVYLSSCEYATYVHAKRPEEDVEFSESQSVVSCLRRVLRELRSSRQVAGAHNCRDITPILSTF